MNKLRIVEWFGGLGAYSEAIKRNKGKENVEIVDYVELDKHATKSFNAINGTNFEPRDINDVDVNNYGDVDILIAGWPCQDLSVAGKGAGIWGNQMKEAIRVFKQFQRTGKMEKLVMEKRSGLIFTTIQNIQLMKQKPRHILLENVKGLISKKWEKDVTVVKKMFDVMGYEWQQVVLNSKYFGVPQARERVFIILTRNDLEQKDITHLAGRSEVTKVLRDVLDFNEPTCQITIPDAKKGLIYFTNQMKQYTGKTIELDLDKLNNQTRGKINKVAKLGTVENDKFKEHSFNQKKDLLGLDGVAKTLRAGDCDNENKIIFNDKSVKFAQDRTFNGGDYKNKVIYGEDMVIHYRKLSPLECWRLMGFSDESFNKVKEAGVSNSQMAKQAGNSIVVNVLEAISEVLF